MDKLVHGGDWAGYKAQFGKEPLDFSANVSPLGLPEGVKAAMADPLAAERYPDPLCRGLRTALGEYFSLPADWVLCGNGAADLIWRLAAVLGPGRGLVTAPSFAEYEAAMAFFGWQTERFFLYEKNDFTITADFAARIRPGTKLVFLCQPGNPTGQTVGREVILAALRRCRAVGAKLVVDECFVGFLNERESITSRGLLADWPELVILGAFTKLWGMAGLRLGWCLCSDAALLQKLAAAAQPWSVNGPAQAAGIAALQDIQYPEKVRALLQTERPRMIEGLQALGLRVVPGKANYLLFYTKRPLLEGLAQRGVVIRSCENYPGLGRGWYRTAIRTEAENKALLAALAEVLKE